MRGHEPEAALLASYDYGRQQLADDRSLLDVVMAHHQALLASGLSQYLTPAATSMLTAAQEVLLQSLVPFEAARRGFADANLTLRALNDTLEQRAADRTRELARRVQQLNGLNEISRAIVGSVDLQYVLHAIVPRAVVLSDADFGAIFQLDPITGALVYGASHTGDPATEGDRALETAGLGLMAHVARLRQPLQLPDLDALEEVEFATTPEDLKPWRDIGVRAVLVLPLVRGDELAGLVWLGRETPGLFAPETIQLMTTFAAQSTLAIYNARLFQELRRYSQALEVANEHKSEFLARMSHELRTPLNAIIGFSEVLLDRSPSDVSEEQRRSFLSHIHRSGKHLLELIGDILDLSKVEAGRMELDLRTFALADVIDGCAAVVRVLAEEKGIILTTTVEPEVATIYADPGRMKQIVYNLLSNAVKFTPSGGRITVTARVTSSEAVVEVSDTGIGISPDDQALIFDEFRQVKSRAPNQEGTGLGLAVVRKLLELHGGRIWVRSAPGEGSCFTFALPTGLVQ